MLTNQQIKTLTTRLQTTEYNIAQEYCQHIFLSTFYKLPSSDQVFFKGGTALRIIFDSPRFSEDLDFSSNLSVKKLEETLMKTLTELQNLGLSTQLLESKVTSGGFLAVFTCQFLNFSVQLQMEVSKRSKTKLSGELFTINSEFIPVYTLFALQTEKMIAEKIKATLSRKKPRDFFDIYFLLRSRLINPKQKKNLLEIKNSISSSRINFTNELKQFLPISFHHVIKDFKKTLSNEINRNI